MTPAQLGLAACVLLAGPAVAAILVIARRTRRQPWAQLVATFAVVAAYAVATGLIGALVA